MKNTIKQFIIESGTLLRQGLIKMTEGHKGILFVLNEKSQLQGVLTDGDIRRALVDGVSLDIPIDKVMNINPVVVKTRQDAENLLISNPEFLAIPVVDENGFMLGIQSSLKELEGYFEQESKHEKVTEAKKTRILAIVPARGGSTRVPRKNLMKVGGESLLAHAINTAKLSQYIDDVLLSTDDPEIARQGQIKGASFHDFRPKDLATSEAKTVDVILHEVEKFKELYGYIPELIVLLEPTAPLRTPQLVDKAIKIFLDSNHDSLVSVNTIRHTFHPEELLTDATGHSLQPYLGGNFDNRKLRGEQNELYVQNGLIYITRSSVLIHERRLYGKRVQKFETDPALFLDIDTAEDLKLAHYKWESKV